MRTALPSLLLLSCVVSAVVVDGYHAPVALYPNALHQRSSHFVGRDVLLPQIPSSADGSAISSSTVDTRGRRDDGGGGDGGGRRRRRMDVEMKKGKANLPSHMRSQYKRSQEMEAYRKQMIESQVSVGERNWGGGQAYAPPVRVAHIIVLGGYGSRGNIGGTR